MIIRNIMRLLSAAGLLAALLVPMSPPAFASSVEPLMRMNINPDDVQETVSGKARIVDGDTLEVAGRKIRFHGVDAPEGRQECEGLGGEAYPCGRLSGEVLARLVGNQEVDCYVVDTDRYRRLIAKCAVNGYDLASAMVLNGWAVAYSYYSKDYVDHEAHARLNRLGIWSGRFDNPRDWRSGKRRVDTDR